MAPRQRHQALTPRVRQRGPGRVVDGGLDQDQAHAPPCQHLRQEVHTQPLRIDRHADQPRAGAAEGLQRAHKGRRLDDHLVARLDQRLRDQGQSLRRARENQDLVRRDRTPWLAMCVASAARSDPRPSTGP